MNKSESRDPNPIEQANAKRQERANRILDAAQTLILRWGYNKTTIDDIARQAGVAKGTIYLHWKTREDLFRTLVIRENLLNVEDLKHRLADDPYGHTLRQVMKHSAMALMKRPLLKALLLNDIGVLGKLTQDERGVRAEQEKITSFQVYLEILRAQGLVRTDLSLKQQTYLLTIAFLGSFLIAPLMPGQLSLTDEELADLIAEMVQRSLETELANSAEGRDPVENPFVSYLARYEGLIREQFIQEIASQPSGKAHSDAQTPKGMDPKQPS